MPKEKIKTYVKGLDDALGGGIPKGHIVLLSGYPGTMKSSLAFYMLYNNAFEEDRTGIFMSLEQSRESLLDHMENMGMEYEPVKNKMFVFDFSTMRENVGLDEVKLDWIDLLKNYADKLKQSWKYELLVVDSLSVFNSLAGVKDKRTELFHFFRWLKNLNVTVFIVSEISRDQSVLYEEDFLADGVIKLTKERVGINSIRHLEIDKMRNTHHSTDYFALLYDGNNFKIAQSMSE